LREVSEEVVYNAGKYIVGNYTFLFQHNFWCVDLLPSLPDFSISSARNNAAILGRVITWSLICGRTSFACSCYEGLI
jgi:hypothetical protein